MKKMNNKGFSLVELIVVVLIMAIIAVALAPQVMKWVENSRISTDCDTYDGLIANIQVALTDKAAYALAKPSSYSKTFTISNSGTVYNGTAGSSYGKTDGDDVAKALYKVNPQWYTAKSKVNGASYVITVTGDGTTISVDRTTPPSTAGNTDLS